MISCGVEAKPKACKWSVEQPAGSNQTFQPSPDDPAPTFAAKAPGEYKFCLDVWNASGDPLYLTTAERDAALTATFRQFQAEPHLIAAHVARWAR